MEAFKALRIVIIAAIIFMISAFCMRSCAQFKVKEHIAPVALVFAAGAFEGIMDHLQFHYDKPNQFWNPDISWVRKYKNHDPNQGKTFAGKYMVWTTDGWHMMKFGRNITLFTGFMLHVNKTSFKKRWYWLVLEGVGYWAVNRAGFNLTYNLLK